MDIVTETNLNSTRQPKSRPAFRHVLITALVIIALCAAYFALRPTLIRHAYLPRRSFLMPIDRTSGGPSLSAISISPDGKIVAGTEYLLGSKREWTSPARVFLWDVGTGRLLRTITAHRRAVWNADFSPDGRFLMTTGADATVKCWRLDTGMLAWTQKANSAGTQFPCYSPDGTIIACPNELGHLSIWDAGTGRPLHPHITLPVPHGPFSYMGETNFAFSPDGRLLAIPLPQFQSWPQNGIPEWTGGEVRLYDTKTGHTIRTLPGLWTKAVAFSPDGKLIASTGPTNSFGRNSPTPCYVQVCDVATGKKLWSLNYPQRLVTSVAFLPGTHFLALLSFLGNTHIDIVDTNTGTVHRTLSAFPQGNTNIFISTPCGLSISRDGRTLVSRDSDHVLVWDTSSLH